MYCKTCNWVHTHNQPHVPVGTRRRMRMFQPGPGAASAAVVLGYMQAQAS